MTSQGITEFGSASLELRTTPERLSSSFVLPPKLEWLLRSSVALILIGRAVQHLFRGAPFAALFWNQELLEGAVKFCLGWDWQRWATDRAVVNAMQVATRLHGAVYLATAVAVLLPMRSLRWRRLQQAALLLCGVLLVCLAGFYYLDAKRQLGQLLEHSLQCALIAILWLTLRRRGRFVQRQELWIRWAIAGTFLGHGLYAAGFYEVPGQFVTMTMRGFAVDELSARSLLSIAGVLDFIVALGVLVAIRVPKINWPVLAYATIWGSATALARVLTYFRWDMAFERISEWLHETLLRLPHGLAPLFLLLLLVTKSRSRQSIGVVE